jgi:hypothetical protein
MHNRQQTTDEKQSSTRQRQTEPAGPVLAAEGLAPQQISGVPNAPGTRALRQASVLRMQRTQGNNAVQRVLLQRQDEEGGAQSDLSGSGGSVRTSGGGVEISSNGPLTISAPVVNLDSAFVRSQGILQSDTLITNSVIASSYTPGAGNIW